MTYYLYRITNITLNKAYIGVTKNPKHRKARHLSGCGSKLIAEHLSDNLVFEILVTGSERYILDLESKVINLLNTRAPNGYNITGGGECGPSKSGELNPNSKLTEKDVVNIRFYYATGKTAVELADKYKISRQAIGTIVRGENWKNSPGPITLGRRKLVSNEESMNIKKLQRQGMSHNEISKALGRPVATVLLHMEL